MTTDIGSDDFLRFHSQSIGKKAGYLRAGPDTVRWFFPGVL